jgi:hypothetical protein
VFPLRVGLAWRESAPTEQKVNHSYAGALADVSYPHSGPLEPDPSLPSAWFRLCLFLKPFRQAPEMALVGYSCFARHDRKIARRQSAQF